jgi:hypothetical protein
MDISTWITASVIVGVVMLLTIIGARLITSRMSRNWIKHRAVTIDAWQAEGIEFVHGPTVCQFGGLGSMSPGQLLERGPGYAVLTLNDLRVSRVHPSDSWIVTLRQIKGVSLARKFKGKVVNKTPFIIVKFTTDGQSDKIAFQVKEYETWATTLANAAGVKIKDKSNT